MVTQEVERMMARLKVAEVTPTIVSLQEQLEQIRAGGDRQGAAQVWTAHAGAGTSLEADARHHQ
jgi:glutamyl-tRNA reductase